MPGTDESQSADHGPEENISAKTFVERQEQPDLQYFTSRDQYRQTLDQFLCQARQTVDVVAVSFVPSSETRDLYQTVTQLVSTSPTFVLTISLLSPSCDAVRPLAYALGLTSEQLREQIRVSLQRLADLRRLSSQSTMERYRILLHDVLPFGSAFIVDGRKPSGIIHVETRLYGDEKKDCFGYRVTGGCPFYQRNLRSWTKILEASRPFL